MIHGFDFSLTNSRKMPGFPSSELIDREIWLIVSGCVVHVGPVLSGRERFCHLHLHIRQAFRVSLGWAHSSDKMLWVPQALTLPIYEKLEAGDPPPQIRTGPRKGGISDGWSWQHRRCSFACIRICPYVSCYYISACIFRSPLWDDRILSLPHINNSPPKSISKG